MAAVAVRTPHDIERLQQYLYEALETQLAADNMEEISEAKTALGTETALFARVLELCLTTSERRAPVAEEGQEPSGAADAALKVQRLQEELDAAAARLAGLRTRVPAALGNQVQQSLVRQRPVEQGDNNLTEMTVEPSELRPDPEKLQLCLSSVSQSLPALRAKLAESVERLRRVCQALDPEAVGVENIKPTDNTDILPAAVSESNEQGSLHKRLALALESCLGSHD